MNDPRENPSVEPASKGSGGGDSRDTIVNGVRSVDSGAEAEVPVRIGRYRIERLLGRGGFGLVYQAHDEQLGRSVALKVPHSVFVASPEEAARFLAEARAVANLDHPNIVPVYGVEQSEGCCFIVYKLIAGAALSDRRTRSALGLAQAAALIALIADALNHAHERDIFHLDVKPGNILLDAQGTPYLSDFGLSVREIDLPTLKDRRAGTVPYMAPEQLRGEGHRVDGRTDIYQLGVVLYELLAGRRPFQSESVSDLIEKIIESEPRPPRQRRQRAAENEDLERELERICLRAMSKRMTDRYTTARDFADELRSAIADHPLSTAMAIPASTAAGSAAPDSSAGSASAASGSAGAPHPSSTFSLAGLPVTVVPRGLCSFGPEDKDFFLGLVAGPRDRYGIPEPVRFWQSKIECWDPQATFPVGVLYGPSGCGKSSLVRAGLLPRLTSRVRTIYVEASRDETESRLELKLKALFPHLPSGAGLAPILTELRRGGCLGPGEKLFLVIDQFEQWLNARGNDEGAELVRALRQCDGEKIQCLILVRDDFGAGIMRFLRNGLETGLVQGRNFALVDLFDAAHARKVLAAFGQAFNRLPADLDELSVEQRQFLDEAVDALAENGRVIPVRLSLFAEMLKDQPWVPATLRRWGGFQGLGVRFLEETFGAGARNPEYRAYRVPARAVLKTLLPDAGLEIKGQMQPVARLAAAAGYSGTSIRLARLLEILDGELHLIAPTEVDSPLESEDPRVAPRPEEVYYQLSHDYLVGSLHRWLNQEQRRTWRGRAEICLKERSAEWARTRHRRSLPTFPEYCSILAGVGGAKRAPVEREMLRAAARRHIPRWGAACLVAGVMVVGLIQFLAARQKTVEAQVESLVRASADEVPSALDRLRSSRRAALPLLRARMTDSPADSRAELHALYGLAALGDAPLERLAKAVASAPDDECGNLVNALRSCGEAALALLNRENADDLDSRIRIRRAIVLWHLNDSQASRELCAFDADPSRRTEFCNAYPAWHGSPADIAERLSSLGLESSDAALRSGLCLRVGGLSPDGLSVDLREQLRVILEDFYKRAPDSTTHSAAGWALTRWELRLPPVAAAREGPPDRRWFHTSDGLVMVSAPPGSFVMGDASLANAPPHPVRFTRGFFIADRETPVRILRLFLSEPESKIILQQFPVLGQTLSLDDEAPAAFVPWEGAVLFCNWLSRRESKQPCYRKEAAGDVNPRDAPANAGGAWVCDFSADGYRLPTEAEWEYACRAGTTTSYSFGIGDRWIDQYVVSVDHSGLQPSASAVRPPNNWGLFDMHGNLSEWCWDWFDPQPGRTEQVDPRGPPSGSQRVSRGGTFIFPSSECRSASRMGLQPQMPSPTAGFRMACTSAN